MEMNEFLQRARFEAKLLEAWIEAGWLMPRRDGDTRRFSEVDIARAQLIHDLLQDLGVNEEGIPVILDLVDQLHGLRRTLREVLAAVGAQPEDTRQQIIAEIRVASMRT